MSKYGCKDKQVSFDGVLKYIPDPRMKSIDSNAKYSLGTQLIIEVFLLFWKIYQACHFLNFYCKNKAVYLIIIVIQKKKCLCYS